MNFTNYILMNNYLSFIRYSLTLTLCVSLLFACEEREDEAVSPVANNGIPEATLNQLRGLGFDVSDIQKQGENFLVEGDIVLTPTAISNMLSSEPVIVNNAQGEQYRTFNLVSRNLRTIRIRPTSNNARFLLAIDRAIFNYNQLGLTFNMERVSSSSSAEITVRLSSGNSFLGSAGFPTGNGLPWNSITIDVSAFSGDDDFAEQTMTHEIGHCLGLRHSDWYDRSLSCGGQPVNEENPPSGLGAVGIPGTVQFDRSSLMNSCGAITSDPSGEFSFYDQVALQSLY